MSTFKRALQICGLSQQEAAYFFDVRVDTIKSWSAGRNPVPPGVWKMLADLFEQIQDAAEGGLKHMAENGIDERAFANISADTVNNELPHESACEAAGAMALLMALSHVTEQSNVKEN